MLTSTSPLLLLRPMVMRLCRTMYSNSLPSSRAIAAPFDSGFHCILEGLAGADLRASRAQASLSWVLVYVDISLSLLFYTLIPKTIAVAHHTLCLSVPLSSSSSSQKNLANLRYPQHTHVPLSLALNLSLSHGAALVYCNLSSSTSSSSA